jgi:hypothetical protein
MVKKYEMSLNHLLRIEATNRAMLLKSSGLSMRSCHPEPRGDFPVHQLGLQHLGHSSILKRGHIPLPGLLSMGYLPMFLAKNIQKDVETSTVKAAKIQNNNVCWFKSRCLAGSTLYISGVTEDNKGALHCGCSAEPHYGTIHLSKKVGSNVDATEVGDG